MKKLLLILVAVIALGCQKEDYTTIIEGNWQGTYAEHKQNPEERLLTLAMFNGEVLFDTYEKIDDPSWEGGFGTYTVSGKTITFDIKIGAQPKSESAKNLTYAEIIDNDGKITLNVKWEHAGAEESSGWIKFNRFDGEE